MARLLQGSPQCIVGNSPSPPQRGLGKWVWGVQPPGAGLGPVWTPPLGAGETEGLPLGLGGGRCRAAGPGHRDVRRGRELAQVDKAGENRNPWSGGRCRDAAGAAGRSGGRAGGSWGRGIAAHPGMLVPSRQDRPQTSHCACNPSLPPSRLPPGSSSSPAIPPCLPCCLCAPGEPCPPNLGTHRDPHPQLGLCSLILVVPASCPLSW